MPAQAITALFAAGQDGLRGNIVMQLQSVQSRLRRLATIGLALVVLCGSGRVSAMTAREIASAILRSSGVNTTANAANMRTTNFRPVAVPDITEIVRMAEEDGWTAEDSSAVGEALERTRQWGHAVRVYKASLEVHPDDETLVYALRRSEVHQAVAQRYTDDSFESNMLRQSRSEALDLMEDVLTHVQMEYVDVVRPTKFIAHGTESLYMALGNDRFLKHHKLTQEADGVTAMRQLLVKRYWNRRISSRLEARLVVSEVCDAAQRELKLPASAIVMEYLFGGFNALDDYSTFLTPDRDKDINGSIEGQFVGIGIEMEAAKGKGMHLVNVLLESPAEEGGLRPGDHIVGINGTDIRDFTTHEAARLLRGRRDSRVNLEFTDPDGKRNRTTLTRRQVKVRSVTRVVMLDDAAGIGYIRMTGFQKSTLSELNDALRKLEMDGMRALIWDVRGNPGGLLDTAADVLNRFIDRGVLVSTRGRVTSESHVFRADSYNTTDVPLVLLVDGNSASASEIVAGAIRDHKRGQIVGEKTYGKWSVQTILPMVNNTGLKLTTAKFYSPNDHNYAGIGLEPDIAVDVDSKVRRTLSRARTSDEIREDPDVSRAMELFSQRYTLR